MSFYFIAVSLAFEHPSSVFLLLRTREFFSELQMRRRCGVGCGDDSMRTEEAINFAIAPLSLPGHRIYYSVLLLVG